METELDERIEAVVGVGYNPVRLIVALEEPDESRKICDECGQPVTYVTHKDLYICDGGHIQ